MSVDAAENVAQKRAKVNPLPPKEYLEECFTYNAETGDLIWKRRPRSHFKTDGAFTRFTRMYTGKVAGYKASKSDGRRSCVGIVLYTWKRSGDIIVAHRVIFAMLGIEVPEGMEIDHKNRDPWDNKFENLRLATQQQNCFNRKSRKDKVDGLPKGIGRCGKKFIARIAVEKKLRHLGTFLTQELAEQAYKEAVAKYHGEFAFADTAGSIS